MFICKLTHTWATERAFNSVNACSFKLLEHDDSLCTRFGFCDVKPTSGVLEARGYLREYKWEGFANMWLISNVSSVREHVLASRVAMKIYHQVDFSISGKWLDHTLRGIDNRMQLLARVFPSTVKVLAYKTTTIISINNPIRVKHRNYLEYVFFSEAVCLRWWPSEKLKSTFHHPWPNGLTWVNSGRNYNSTTGFDYIVRASVSYRYLFAVVTSESFRQYWDVTGLTSHIVLFEKI